MPKRTKSINSINPSDAVEEIAETDEKIGENAVIKEELGEDVAAALNPKKIVQNGEIDYIPETDLVTEETKEV